MLLSSFYLLVLSLLFFVNFGFFFLSEEVLVFTSSLFFVSLVFLSLRASARRYFFLRAYHVYTCFLYGLLAYLKVLSSLHLGLQSLVAHGLLLLERNRLVQQGVLHRFLFSVEFTEILFQRRFPGLAFEAYQSSPLRLGCLLFFPLKAAFGLHSQNQKSIHSWELF